MQDVDEQNVEDETSRALTEQKPSKQIEEEKRKGCEMMDPRGGRTYHSSSITDGCLTFLSLDLHLNQGVGVSNDLYRIESMPFCSTER